MVHFADAVTERTVALQSPIVAGLDPRPDLLPDDLRRAADSPRTLARAYVTFGRQVLDGLVDVVPAVKIQIAFYEALGIPGVHAYATAVRDARERGLLVIGDIKRGDIGSTAEAYVEGHFGGPAAAMGADVDAVTLNPYLGVDSLSPFLRRATEHGKGAFALVRTSNPSARELQDLVVDGRPVYEHTAALVSGWGAELRGASGYSSLGAVVGATYPDELRRIRELHPELLLLIPGYGAQGGGPADVVSALDERGAGALIASSRGLMKGCREAADDGEPPATGVRRLAQKMREEILAAWDARRNNGQ